MDDTSKHLKLLEDFAEPTYDQWLKLVDKQLKGAPFEKKLVTQTVEGISIQPIYRKSEMKDKENLASLPGLFPFTRGTNASGNAMKGWGISQQYTYPDTLQFNEAISQDLSRGLTGISLTLDKAAQSGLDPDNSDRDTVGKGGLSVFCQDDITAAFKGVDLTNAYLLINAGPGVIPALSLLFASLKSNGISLDKINGSAIFDISANLAGSGEFSGSDKRFFNEMAGLVNWTKKNAPGFRAIGIDGRIYCESGGSAVQELAFALSTAVEYLRAMQRQSISIDHTAESMSFFFGLGPDFFMEIAKLRAARTLWARIVSTCGGQDVAQKMNIHAGTARFNKTIHDPYVNLLRATTEAYSGVLGGCDSLEIAPFDEVFGLPDELSRRIARNIQIILKEECHGHKVIDPGGGAWFVENLTDRICQEAWTLFQEIEKNGGMLKALEQNLVQERITEVAQKRLKSVGQRKSVIVGTNMYPNLNETLPLLRLPDYDAFYKKRSQIAQEFKAKRQTDIDVNQLKKRTSDAGIQSGELIDTAINLAMQGATLGEISAAMAADDSRKIQITPLKPFRQASDYEELRDKAAAFQKKNGQPLSVFLINMGPLRQHKARADFSTDFLQPGGFNVVSSDGFDNVEDAAKATLESGAKIAVICSTDDTYSELVPEITRRVKEIDASITMVVAGYPKEHIVQFKEAGIDEFIHLKANNLEILKKFQEKVGA